MNFHHPDLSGQNVGQFIEQTTQDQTRALAQGATADAYVLDRLQKAIPTVVGLYQGIPCLLFGTFLLWYLGEALRNGRSIIDLGLLVGTIAIALYLAGAFLVVTVVVGIPAFFLELNWVSRGVTAFAGWHIAVWLHRGLPVASFPVEEYVWGFLMSALSEWAWKRWQGRNGRGYRELE